MINLGCKEKLNANVRNRAASPNIANVLQKVECVEQIVSAKIVKISIQFNTVIKIVYKRDVNVLNHNVLKIIVNAFRKDKGVAVNAVVLIARIKRIEESDIYDFGQTNFK